jgi:hypothetical protein
MKPTIVKDYIFGIGIPIGIAALPKEDFFSSNHEDSSIRFRSKKSRRGHVQLFILNLLLVASFGFFGNSSITKTIFVVASLALLITSSLVRYSVLGLVDLPNSRLDERERTLRAEAFVHSYKILGVSLIVALLVSALFGVTMTADHVIVLAVLFFASTLTLPSAVIAWGQEEI